MADSAARTSVRPVATPASRRRAAALAARIEASVEILRSLLAADDDSGNIWLLELVRRAEETAQVDGFPTTIGHSSIHSGRLSDPTASAVCLIAGGRTGDGPDDDDGTPDSWNTRPDVLGKAIETLCSGIVEVHCILKPIARTSKAVHFAVKAKRGRVSQLIDCGACGEPILGDVRNGMDDACRMRFRRLPDPKPSLGEWMAGQRAERQHVADAERQAARARSNGNGLTA